MNPIMNSVEFLSPEWLIGALGAALVGGVVVMGGVLARRRVRKFFGLADPQRWMGLVPLRSVVLSAALSGVVLALVAVAMARPAGDPKPRLVERSGRDVVFVVDVSRSMLAQDVRPSRLDRAKLALSDVLDTLEGDRVGVVAFAGSAVIKCPLTTDYSFARMSLEDLSPMSVTRGGTNLSEALSAAGALLFADLATSNTARSRTVFLLTDGEDNQSQPLDVAKEIGGRGVRVVTIGIGSDLAGAPVPAERADSPRGQSFVSYRGEEVKTKMDPVTLRAIAEATPGGVFLNVGLGNIELDAIYRRLIKTAPAEKLESKETLAYTEYFQVPLMAALVLLALEGGLRAIRR